MACRTRSILGPRGADAGGWLSVNVRRRVVSRLGSKGMMWYFARLLAGLLIRPVGVLLKAREDLAIVQVVVRDNNVDQALKALKKKMQREGIFREMKLRRAYEKPSEKRARQKAEAVRRARKLARKRREREGF